MQNIETIGTKVLGGKTPSGKNTPDASLISSLIFNPN